MHITITVYALHISESRAARARGVNELGPSGVLFHFRPAERAIQNGRRGGRVHTEKEIDCPL